MKKTMSSGMALIMLVTLIAVTLAGCSTPPTVLPAEPTQPAVQATEAGTQPTAAPASTYKEAPALASLVQEGKLPPVDDRLPVDPLVITPNDSVGRYGGTWRQSIPIGNKIHAMASIGYYSGRGLVVNSVDKKEIVPNLASSWEVSEDSKTYTFTLRKSLKWSDGEPMDTGDVDFWWKAIATNTTVTPAQTEWEGVTLNIIDDVTFEITYPTPKPLQLNSMAEFQWTAYFAPEHYLKQFHPDYSDAGEVSSMAKEAGFDDWGKFFLDRNDYQNNADLPTMSPWMLVTNASGASQLVFERNPYYWAVDIEGNQLPYIDSAIMNIVESADITKMKAISGEFEVAVAAVMENFSDYPLYAENAEAGDYTVNTAEFDEPNAMNIHFNMTHKDPVKRAVMEKVEFRQAMSLAIDREEIISVNYTVGPFSSTIRQFSPYPGSPFFDEQLSTQFTGFDAEKANQMLDDLGLDKRNADNMRLLPDGNVFTLVIDVPTFSDQWIDIGTMLADDWKAVGMNVSARSVDPALWGQRITANDFDLTIMTGGGGFAALTRGELNGYTGFVSKDWPNTFNSGNFIWRDTNGTDGVEPSDAIKRLWELGTATLIEPNKDNQMANVKEIIQIHKDNLFVLGIGTRLPAIYLVKNYVKNVPQLDPSWSYGMTGHGRPEQYYIDN